MTQAERDEFTALVDETQMALDAASLPDVLDREAVKVLNTQLGNVLSARDCRAAGASGQYRAAISSGCSRPLRLKAQPIDTRRPFVVASTCCHF